MEATATLAAYDRRLRTRHLKVGVVGLGYAGLPLALAFAEAGFPVTGLDVDPERVAAVRAGRSYLVDVPPERYERAEGRLEATDDYAAVTDLDAIVICVPTPLSKTRTPDLSYVISAAESIAAHLGDGQLVVLQSTTTPGTTEELVLPILAAGERIVGDDFFLAYAPERVDPGNQRYGLRNTPKVVAGVTPECHARAVGLFGSVVDAVVPVSRPIVAELAKLHENTFRAVNIALANELALMCDRLGASPWEVIDAAATKPFAFLPHYPGPGLGGECIPVVPHFLAWRLREHGYSPRLIEAAHEINAHMPLHVVDRVAEALNDVPRPVRGSRVLLLGMAYKPDVHDTRESPSREIFRLLAERGADVRYCDPWVESVVIVGERHRSVAWTEREVRDADCVVLLTAHRRFLTDPLWRHATLLVDTRNVAGPGPTVRGL